MVRAKAIVTYLRCGSDKKAAVPQLMKALRKDFNEAAALEYAAAHAMDNVERWIKNFEETGSAADLPRPGRSANLSREDLTRAAQLVAQGLELRPRGAARNAPQRWLAFHSIRGAINKVPELARLMAKGGYASVETFRKALIKVDPKLKWCRAQIKPALTHQQRQRRQQFAAENMQRAPEWWHRVVFLDMTTVHVLGTDSKAPHIWAHTDDTDFRSIVKITSYKQKSVRIHLYAAVNAQLGLVFHQYVTGTTELGEASWPRVQLHAPKVNYEQPYMVSVTRRVARNTCSRVRRCGARLPGERARGREERTTAHPRVPPSRRWRGRRWETESAGGRCVRPCGGGWPPGRPRSRPRPSGRRGAGAQAQRRPPRLPRTNQSPCAAAPLRACCACLR